MPRVSIIGIGSPFGDDRAGWLATERLAAAAGLAAYAGQVSVTACRSPSSELPGLLAAADIAIVIDAVASGGAPGTVYRVSGLWLPDFVGSHLSSHGLGLQAMLKLAETLGCLPNDIVIYGIEAESVAAGAAMSHSTRRAVSRVTEEIERDIAHYCGS